MVHDVTGTNAVERRNTPSRTPEEDMEGGSRIGAKFQEWHEQWLVRQQSQGQERLLECLDLSEHEEALPLLEVRALPKAAAMNKSTTGVDVDGFHPKMPMDLPDESCKKS